ncbi:hypothetical protein BDN72DRAFT_134269 [Pluteus cervinus]|uniref:Uncharacterized protein n=1 Tax=Pluteus cervinus TaxID=181527 RepID=A0ACD3B840_9AGAR|nr:hypothetical protein BDN72DRAFT_134269 [Pluteus cervinus]
MNNDAKEAVHSLLSLAPTPPQVIPQKRKQSAVATPTIPPQTPDDVSNESIRCICGIDLDDGFSIACDDCGRWCHAACFDVDQLSVPEEWRCWECVPRVVDREKAVKIQRARQKQVEELKDVEKVRRKQSPGVERKSRKQSAPTVDGGGTSRRKRRPSMVQTPLNNHNHNLNLNGNHNEDEHVDIDEPWTQSYVHINEDNVPLKDTRDKLRQQAQHWRGVTAVAGQSPYEAIPILLPPNHPVPPTTIQQLPPHGVNHPALSLYTNHSVRPPSFSFHTAAPVPSDHYITPFTSTITPTSAYLADPLNSYAHLGMPKPFVHLVGPPLDVALDARLSGNKSRFVRSGCKPNAVLRPVLCPRPNSPLLDANGDRSKETLSFGVFALRDLKANEEVVLGWEWDDGNAVHSLPALIETPHMFPGSQLKYLRQQMSNILHALSSTFTTCACGSRAKDCVLTQMAAFVDGDGPVAGPSTINGRVDLGPLVGAKRGFKTRERVPFSGGLAGMEMCEENEPSSSDHGENSRRILKSAKAKGKERAIDDEQRLDAYIKFPSQRRITIDTTRSPRRPRPPDFGDEMDVDGQDMEERMPPKMRKRWIQREVEVLRVASTSSVASPDSVLTPESSGDGAAGRDDDDRTETDDGSYIIFPLVFNANSSLFR